MCNKNNLPNRVKEAKAAMAFAKVTQYDADGNVKVVLLPGHEGKMYQVIIRRFRGISTEQLIVVGNNTIKTGHLAQVTYTQMAAIMIAAKESGYSVTWTANREDAVKLSNFGGKVFRVRNHDNPHNIMWGVLKEKEK